MEKNMCEIVCKIEEINFYKNRNKILKNKGCGYQKTKKNNSKIKRKICKQEKGKMNYQNNNKNLFNNY